MLDQFRLEGQVALVTGVGRGLGQAMAVGLAEAGADIAGVYHTRYEDTETQVTALGRRFVPIQLDLRSASTEQLAQVVDQAVSALGRLDILVNNAGIVLRTPAIDYSEADWDAVLQVNLKSAFFLSQAAARVMVKQGRGKIIQVASLLSFQGGIYVPSYAAAKSGLAGVTKALANEWAALGINVNAIAPGYVRTDNTAALQADPERSSSILSRIPAGRWGEPDDLKGMTVFLASAASDYVHGAILNVDGGWMGR
ncbi:MAG: 2-dehydro-3-deoxy-D-gluconate 5-dehydrogenase KduD [Anaerolineae bacterium]|nr:2-dehydro-3-deoxy-D-gluconate 5-dehydrogenase KduD [Anaerolineae bacterium]